MTRTRESGLFCHISSLPGPQGVGTLGAPARQFVDFLARAEQSLWQCCPVGPTTTEYGNSPYSALSAVAGNPLFVDLRDLESRGWLDGVDDATFDDENVDYDGVTPYVERHLRRAHRGFEERANPAERRALTAFRESTPWLDDYALFRALKRDHDGAAWTAWPEGERDRTPEALADARGRLADEVAFVTFCQFCFDLQWGALRRYANERGVSLVGDAPIYVAGDSADVWANREWFQLDSMGHPTAVAGVPNAPDEVFDGQRWGMPLFDWDALEADGFGWWRERLAVLFERCDLVRLDHFRGLESYWAIPADESDPNEGEWRDVPSEAFFDALEAEFGDLSARLFAEDIGHITAAVDELRRRYGLASLKLLPFVDWCEPDHPHKPAEYAEATVAYTSTHDSETARGAFESLSAEERDCLRATFDGDVSRANVHERFVEAVWQSDAALAFAQVQDVLGLGNEARFNVPGTTERNWSWRVDEAALTDERAAWLAGVTRAAER